MTTEHIRVARLLSPSGKLEGWQIFGGAYPRALREVWGQHRLVDYRDLVNTRRLSDEVTMHSFKRKKFKR